MSDPKLRTTLGHPLKAWRTSSSFMSEDDAEAAFSDFTAMIEGNLQQGSFNFAMKTDPNPPWPSNWPLHQDGDPNSEETSLPTLKSSLFRFISHTIQPKDSEFGLIGQQW